MREAMEVEWLRMKDVEDQALVRVLQRDLDRGEAEAIALAVQVKANWTLLDEREGRRVAKSLLVFRGRGRRRPRLWCPACTLISTEGGGCWALK